MGSATLISSQHVQVTMDGVHEPTTKLKDTNNAQKENNNYNSKEK